MHSFIKKNKYILVALMGPVSAVVLERIYIILGVGFLHDWTNTIPISFLPFYASGTLRFVLGIAAILILGWMIKQNGFKYVFSVKGAKKALFASSANFLLLLWFLSFVILPIFSPSFAGIEQLTTILPPYIFFNMSVGLYEEVVYRGLLLVTLLYFWGNSAIGRILCMIPACIIFTIGHPTPDLINFFLYFFFTMSFCAIFIYSKNLLILILLHFVHNVVIVIVQDAFIQSVSESANIVMEYLRIAIILFIIPVFAIYLCVKATPIREEIKLRFVE